MARITTRLLAQEQPLGVVTPMSPTTWSSRELRGETGFTGLLEAGRRQPRSRAAIRSSRYTRKRVSAGTSPCTSLSPAGGVELGRAGDAEPTRSVP
jgi:hypothetical protein